MENCEATIKTPPTALYDFPKLIRGGENKYVDKTELLYRLAKPKTDAQYFISRPRRFGKSLMLSTLKAMFEGRRELFKGLALDSLPWEAWETPTPVYSFTMSSANGGTYEKFQAALSVLVADLCEEIDIPYISSVDASVNFDAFLKAAAAKSPTKQIVVLVDEYDEPVAKFLDDLETLKKVRSDLHDFYEKLKVNSGTIRFLMITGVTKLTKLSIFSGLNHLIDLSMSPECATLLGYTPNELDGPLRENVEAFAAKNGMDFAAARKTLLSWYDGYRFGKARIIDQTVDLTMSVPVEPDTDIGISDCIGKIRKSVRCHGAVSPVGIQKCFCQHFIPVPCGRGASDRTIILIACIFEYSYKLVMFCHSRTYQGIRK